MSSVRGDEGAERCEECVQVFTDSMAAELWSLMEAEGWEGVAETKVEWASTYAPRTMVAGFMKDKAIGAKRLASMPDRITNTINTADGQQVMARATSPAGSLQQLTRATSPATPQALRRTALHHSGDHSAALPP